MAYESVTEAYNGKTIFLTGATGFLGKVILEKLLYSCPGVEKVYLLVREMPNENANQRIENLLEKPLFSRLKGENPKVFEKITPITGDLLEPNMGISATDEQLLIDTVSIVFHVAATVKFNEPLERAIDINVIGTEQVLSFAKRIKNIQAFLYISTAYSNTDREVINEVVYPPPAPLSEVKKNIEIGISEEETKKLLNERPNTYTFTKALAENLVANNHEHVPAVIIRPSIICPSNAEPMVGWVDNWFGATAVIASIGKGFIRVLLGDPNNVIDFIPVDYVSNLAIVAAAKCKSSKEVQVYNSCTSGENPLTLKKVSELIVEDTHKHKFNDLPATRTIFTKFRWLVSLIILFEYIPLLIADIILLLVGKTARYQKIQVRINAVRNTMEYFIANTWKIHATETKSLYDSLSVSDKHIFPFDPTNIDWDMYIPKYCLGIRKFLYKL